MTGGIAFRDLTIATGRDTALVDKFCLDVGEGEVVALIGESGAGKSTIGLSALGYVRPGCWIAGGQVLFEEADIAALRRDQLRSIRGRRVAYVAQSAAAAFNPTIRIIDQLVEAALVHHVMDRQAAIVRAHDLGRRMELPTIDELVQRFPHELSGGQLQRLMTVMALMCRPAMLVLDEPTTALDVTTQLGVLIALKQIIEEECVACLYISHDLAVVAQIAHRIVVLRDGKVVEVGNTAQILTAPRAAYTRELIAATAGFGRGEPLAVDEAEPVLELRDVEARYGWSGSPVLSNISFSVRAGACVAIIGESGSGKSTLARVVTGLLPTSKGEIRHNGVRLESAMKNRSIDQLRQIQLVLQHPDLSLNPRIKIGDALGRPLARFFGLRGLDQDRRVAQLLDFVELPAEMAARYPSQLSGGQKQRVNLARALAAKPDLLICDEVTSALDTIVGAKILKLLATIRAKTGAACIFITHDILKAAAIADDIHVMRNGEIVDSGPPMTLFATPRHSYTRTLLRSVPELRTDWLSERMRSAAAAGA